MLKRVALAVVVQAALVAGPAPALAQEGWMISDGGMGAGKACVALKRGPEINTRLMRNGRDQMILIAANAAWDSTDPTTAQLSIDGGEAATVLGLRVGPLVMVQVDKPEMEAALKTARTLDWAMTWGNFHAEVAGLGEAYGQLQACR